MICPFCDIVGSDSERIIENKENCFVIFSNPRLMKGHLLVIPKRHVEKLSELGRNEKEELFNTVIEYQEKILSKFSSGCDIRQNCRPFLAQDNFKVDHVHIHIQPREIYDELYEKVQIFEKDVFHEMDKTENSEIVAKMLE